MHHLLKEPSAFRYLGSLASPASQAFFRGVDGNLQLPCNSCELHASKISTEWMAERSVPICIVGQVLLDHTCSALVIRVTEK